MKKIEAKVKCVNCGTESEQEIVYSSHTFNGTRHLDTRFDNGEVNVNVQVCPNCHYCNFDIASKSKSAKSIMKSDESQTLAKSKLDTKVKQYIIAAMVNEKDKKSMEAGKLYLAASWIFEDKKDSKNANKYRQLAVKNLIKNVKKDEEGHLTLQCIDLLRKNKEFDEAQKLMDYLKKETGASFMQVYLEMPNVNLTEMVEDEEVSLLLKIAKFEQQLIKNKDFADHLIDEIEDNKKMKLNDFYCLFLENRKKPMPHSQITIYTSILYSLSNDWFNAVVEYLKTGKETELYWNAFSTKKIREAYYVEKLDYIDVVVLLESLRKAEQQSYITFFPYEVE